MYHQLYQVVDFNIVDDYVVWVKFDDETEQIIDFEPVLHGEIWGPLRDIDLFNQVMIDPIAHTLSWPDGADFDPETLRHWPIYQDELVMRARQWDAVLA
ncbi:MAG: DUF2442 domain-containing protein [Anaerolineae bacterium]